MALNINTEVAIERADRDNMRSIAAHVDDDHYRRRFTPGDFVLGGGANHVQIPLATPQWPAIELPDAVTAVADVSWDKASEWRFGKFKLRIAYTSDVGDTANFNIRYRVLAIRVGEVLPGTLLTASPATLALAGPAVAFTLMRTVDLYTTVSFGGDDEYFALQVFRDGAGDANNNDFYIVFVDLWHIPAVHRSA